MGERALRLCHHGARVVEPEQPALGRGRPEGDGRRQLVQVLGRVVAEHHVHRSAVSGGTVRVHHEVVRADDVPGPAQRGGLAPEEIGEPELLPMRGIGQDRQPGRTHPETEVAPVGSPRRGEGPAEASPRPPVDVVLLRSQRLGGPDLALARGLVAVVLERREPAVRALEDIEAAPEERRR